MRREPKWLSNHAVLAIHEALLAEHGGARGIRDKGLLEAALAAPKNRFVYKKTDIASLAAAYAWALTRNHPFADGNKRVALTAAGVFMELNGLRLEASEEEAAQALRALSGRRIDEPGFAQWLRARSSKIRVRTNRKPRTSRRDRSRKRF